MTEQSIILIVDINTGVRWEYLMPMSGQEVAPMVKKRLDDLITLLNSPSAEEIGV
jgi:hypothetical protein